MCTIMTVGKKSYTKQKQEITARIQSDARLNSDGYALLCLDPNKPDTNIKLHSMDIAPILFLIDYFFNDASKHARIFLHCRMATTYDVGVAYTHGFDDREGTVIMHNGILRSGYHLDVDSFILASMRPKNAEDLLTQLVDQGENYANIFMIDTRHYSYQVVRLQTNTLYRNEFGDYSTNPVGDISIPVGIAFAKDHVMNRKRPNKKKDDIKDWMDRWQKNKGSPTSFLMDHTDDVYGWDRYPTEPKPNAEIDEQAEWDEYWRHQETKGKAG